ncbi:hypothetical protein SEA_GODPHATHER_63 [Mycobacterium phage GodPhather]|uniref:Uncharacterized protein n=1 Tax=Mycobacterium phage Jeon TaxID=2108123 RepID=A0A2P1JRI5_9CAUD|nr:hypothetical protein PQB70_gp62 [Mycobacterium phage Jeon]AVO21765.1 hypothetical protein SEA_JEON_62 [Mycobacterium phage Jeon]QBP32636.1 hypothetical protein SEA_GODPHATHER_63 [Mycobacterium phage GodPhather]
MSAAEHLRLVAPRTDLVVSVLSEHPDVVMVSHHGEPMEPITPADARWFAAALIAAAAEAEKLQSEVIQLPEPAEAVTMQDCAGSGKPFKPGTLSRDGEVAKCSACGTNRYVRDDGSIEPHQVPVAAVLAEGEDK